MTTGDLAISGLGAVCSVGGCAEDVFQALCAGKSGLAPLRGFDAAKFRSRHAYEVADRPRPGHDVPGRATVWLLAAIAEALGQAGLEDDLRDVPVLIGTGLRELRSAELWWGGQCQLTQDGLSFGPALRDRFNAATVFTLCNACSASLYALALGSDMIALGAADTVVVAGTDSITTSMFGLLDRVSPAPVEAVRPFSRDCKGVLMGDGAAAVVLSRAEFPRLAKLKSVSVNCDAFHPTAPDLGGIVEVMLDAHERAGIEPGHVDLVVAHGTGTLLNDKTEAIALTEVFGAVGGPLVTAIKSMTGHTSGSSGLLSLVVAVKALQSGRVPPTAGLAVPMPEAAPLRFVRGAEAMARLRVAQVEAFGFGGVNAIAVVEKEG